MFVEHKYNLVGSIIYGTLRWDIGFRHSKVPHENSKYGESPHEGLQYINHSDLL